MKDEDFEDILGDLGFEVVPVEILMQAYEAMIEYLSVNTGLDRENLSEALTKLENLIGEEECYKLELEDIVSWVKAFQ